MVVYRPIIERRLIAFIEQDEHFVEWRSDGLTSEEILAEFLVDDSGYFSLLDLYKHAKWGNHFENTAGKHPVTSPQELERVSRKVDEKLLVMCGWLSEEGGLNGHCAYCGVPITIHEMTIEHVDPKSKSHNESLDNLVPACYDCNHEKLGRSTTEYLRSIGFEQADIDSLMNEWKQAFEYRALIGRVWQMRLSGHQLNRLRLDAGNSDRGAQ
ncbi:MAG: HNH endonuclease domain-containing protein [Phycisphaerales bacterium]